MERAQSVDMLMFAIVKNHLKIHYKTQSSECNAPIIASQGGTAAEASAHVYSFAKE